MCIRDRCQVAGPGQAVVGDLARGHADEQHQGHGHDLDEQQATVAEFAAWQPHLAPGAAIAFHDYGHPDFPGVASAVAQLGLEGEVRGGMFVSRPGGG